MTTSGDVNRLERDHFDVGLFLFILNGFFAINLARTKAPPFSSKKAGVMMILTNPRNQSLLLRIAISNLAQIGV